MQKLLILKMEDLYTKNSFADLNVVLHEGKKASQDVLQMVTECELIRHNKLGHVHGAGCISLILKSFFILSRSI